MTPHVRRVLRYLAHHNAKETARAFRISERQVRRLLCGTMDRLGMATEYEAFRWAERPVARIVREPELSLWETP